MSYRNARGIARMQAGQYPGALEDFDVLIRSNPKEPLHYNIRCYTLAVDGRVQEALPDCDKALSIRPDFAGALDTRGFVYLRLGQYQAAIEDYDAALRIAPRTAAALYGRGVARLRSGDMEGNADIEEAVKIQPAIAGRMARIGVTP